jgi:hypothetical protein
MHIETKGKGLSALLDLYNKEIDILKSKLLIRIPWEELVVTRKNITELAIAIHKCHNNKVPEKINLLDETKNVEEHT